MFEWLRRLCCGSSTPVKPGTEIDLRAEGYSPQFVDKRVRDVRGTLIELREHARVIADSGADKGGHFDQAVHRTCTSVEKVLQNLKRDPDDFSRMGLALESLGPLNELVERCAHYAATGVEEGKLNRALNSGKEALAMTAQKFEKLHNGPLQLDDELELKGLRKTVEDLNK